MNSEGGANQIEPAAASPVHDAFFYRGVEEYARTILAFVRNGSRSRDRFLIAVPQPKTRLLRTLLEGSQREIVFTDMSELGRNPARIIPALRRFLHAHPGTSTRFVSEAIWPGRNGPELAEAILHESLMAAAVAAQEVTVLCPHDAEALDPEVLESARRTHRRITDGEGHCMSATFDPDLAGRIARQPLPAVPGDSRTLMFQDGDLSAVRRFVEEGAGRPGCVPRRLDDLLLAVNEVATNTLVHAGPPGTIHLWRDETAGELICELDDAGPPGTIHLWRDGAAGELICELDNAGRITDPLAGRSGPYPVTERGWGLWMVNQVCDLVEMRSGEWGTTIRLHMRLAGS